MGKIQIKKQKGEDGYTSFSLRIPLQLSEQINVLWSSVFVTLMAKKYRFMQFELDMVFDTH